MLGNEQLAALGSWLSDVSKHTLFKRLTFHRGCRLMTPQSSNLSSLPSHSPLFLVSTPKLTLGPVSSQKKVSSLTCSIMFPTYSSSLAIAMNSLMLNSGTQLQLAMSMKFQQAPWACSISPWYTHCAHSAHSVCVPSRCYTKIIQQQRVERTQPIRLNMFRLKWPSNTYRKETTNGVSGFDSFIFGRLDPFKRTTFDVDTTDLERPILKIELFVDGESAYTWGVSWFTLRFI